MFRFGCCNLNFQLTLGGENGIHYIRPLDASAFAQAQAPSSPTGGQQGQTVITLPITMPGSKPGDPQQTVQIQVKYLFQCIFNFTKSKML